MENNIALDIASKIVAETLLADWRLYVLMGFLALLGGFAGAWLSAYAKKRGEILATKADLEEIVRHLRETTKAAEEVKSAISHGDWVQREWKALRRVKLEELLVTAGSLAFWLERERRRWIFCEAGEDVPNPGDKISMLRTLYFPELNVDILRISVAHREAYKCVINFAPRVNAAKGNLGQFNTELDAFKREWIPKYEALIHAVADLENACGAFVGANIAPEKVE